MMRKAMILMMVVACSTVMGTEAPKRVFILDGQVLLANRQGLQDGDRKLAPALAQLVRSADAALARGPYSVTDNDIVPPSGDKHDYQSLGPYWWPNPATPDGKPYVRKDGETNPERDALGDTKRLRSMFKDVSALATAWFFTGDEKYAEHSARLLRAWYLDPDTRMNPNMNYAQAIPGRCEGRGIGIVDASGMPSVVDAVGLLQGSRAWTEEDQTALVNWFTEFLRWMQTSKHGMDEDKTRNNHSTQYDTQVMSYALFVGSPEVAKRVANAVKKRRIDSQIEPDGSQPHELARTKSWDYSCTNTRNFTRLAELARHVDVDLWSYDNGGRSITKAIDFLVPYAVDGKEWPHRQITRFKPDRLLRPLLQAAGRDATGRYAESARKLLAATALERLLYSAP